MVNLQPFIGESRPICDLFRLAAVVATTDTPLLIQGETGSGKGVLARWIHDNSRRAGKAFVDVNCAGISKDLLESELFGHEKGAFTGAVSSKPGLFEVADNGTVFLDELGDMDLGIQPKLIKVLEERTFRRVGSVSPKTVDIRLIAATHRDLGDLMHKGLFREDLFFRVNTFPIRLPPLRERAEDIPALCEVLIERVPGLMCAEKPVLTKRALGKLIAHRWPGNIRELQNVLHRAVLLAAGEEIGDEYIVFGAHTKTAFLPSCSATLSDVEKAYIETVLGSCNGRVDEAARVLGVPVSSLYQKITRYGIHRKESRRA